MSSVDLAEQAIHWFMLRHSGEMTEADDAAFDGWLAASPAAVSAYDRVRHAWAATGPLADDPAIAESRKVEADRYRRPRRRGATAAGLVALAATLVIAVMPTGLLSRLDGRLSPSAGGRILQTGPNRRSLVRLPDGSAVTLDVDTRVRIAEMGERRRVDLLAGHAFFRVAKDARHPFTVTATDKTVHAIGTAFDVRIAGDAVAVTLVEGKVRVDQARGLWRRPIVRDMTPGRQLVANDDRPWTMARVDTARATSWLEDRLVYLPDTVGKVVADVNGGSRTKIVFVGRVDSDTKLIGVFRRGDVESVVTALEMEGLAHVVARRADRIEMAQDGPAPGS